VSNFAAVDVFSDTSLYVTGVFALVIFYKLHSVSVKMGYVLTSESSLRFLVRVLLAGRIDSEDKAGSSLLYTK